jgi:aminoglycoside 6-adenylyltransferase
MRSEQEIFNLIIETARKDERIRVVLLNGSRANPNAPRDIFQDFDIVYLVTDVTPFWKNLTWIERFGELMILQMPEDMGDHSPTKDGGFGYLMQFADGNRIDLGVQPLKKLDEKLKDSLTVVLLDKDNLVGLIKEANESGCLPQPPTVKAFADCCNEFWWVSAYVAKGLWRGELPYARTMLDQSTRDELMKMLTWYIGLKTNFSKNPGKFGKYFQRYLEPEQWDLLEKTYANADYEHTWDALFAMCQLFRTAAVRVAEHSGFQYPVTDDEKVSAHLQHVRTLPKDAREIY